MEQDVPIAEGRVKSKAGLAGYLRADLLDRYIIADPAICHGTPSFRGTRVVVADVLADVERGLSLEFILHRWGAGKISKAAVHLARVALLDDQGRLLSVSRAA